MRNMCLIRCFNVIGTLGHMITIHLKQKGKIILDKTHLVSHKLMNLGQERGKKRKEKQEERKERRRKEEKERKKNPRSATKWIFAYFLKIAKL